MIFKRIFTEDLKQRLRSVASQFVACLSTSFLFLDVGMAMNFSTIALPVLLNAKQGLTLSKEEASWFGSIPFLAQPIGALFSGPIVEYFGLKQAIFLVNIPHLIAWPLMYFTTNISSLYAAIALMGVGTGVMEAPINSYVGEISERSTRACLVTVMQLFVSTGMMFIYYLGSITSWRTAAIISVGAPMASVLLCIFAPESPIRLLNKGKEKDALKCLSRLRGWVSEDKLKTEFDELSQYSKRLQICVICEQRGNVTETCPHEHMNGFKKLVLKFRYVILCRQTLQPLIFVILYFSFYVLSGLASFRPNLLNVSRAFGMNQDGSEIVLNVGIITFLSGIVLIVLVRMFGKRKVGISAMLLIAVFTAGLSAYGKNHLGEEVSSYDPSTFPEHKSHVPLVLFYMIAVFNGLSLHWIMFAEVFPFRSRPMAQGFAAASYYVINFIASKTFINLEKLFHLWGAFAVYASFGFIGTVYLYFNLPETEGKSLQEIETYYNGDKTKFANDPVINFFRKVKGKTKDEIDIETKI